MATPEADAAEQRPATRPPASWRRREALLPALVAVALIAVAFAIAVGRVVALEMHTRPSVLVVNAIPVALSELYFGHPKQYMALAGVRKRFLDHLPRSFNPANITSEIASPEINPAIQKVFDMDRHRVGTELVPLGPDDKGIVDLVEVSFLLFGYQTESVTVAYFVVLLISCLAYVAAFWRSPSRLLLVAAFLGMLYLALPMILYNAQLSSVLMLRAMPVLSMLACLHCLLFMASSVRQRPSALQFGLAAVQVGVIALTLHLRTTTLWQVLTIVGFGLVLLTVTALLRILRVPPLPRTGDDVGAGPERACESKDVRAAQRARGWGLTRWGVTRSTVLTVVAVCALTLAAYLAVQQYQAVALQEYQRRDIIATRVFWHNLFSGLAYHPDFGERYQLRIDDASIFAAMRQYLAEQDRLDEWRDMGGEQSDFQELKFAKYDPRVREMLFARCTTYLRECVETILYYKPVALAGNVAWLYGLRALPPELDIVVPRNTGERSAQVKQQYVEATRKMDEHGQRAYLWTPLVLLVLAPFAALLALESRESIWTAWAGCLGLLLGSLIPTTLGYPLPHTILEASIAFGMAIYFGIFFAAATVLPRLLPRWQPQRPQPTAPPSLSAAAR